MRAIKDVTQRARTEWRQAPLNKSAGRRAARRLLGDEVGLRLIQRMPEGVIMWRRVVRLGGWHHGDDRPRLGLSMVGVGQEGRG